jgi:hypothetical protein
MESKFYIRSDNIKTEPFNDEVVIESVALDRLMAEVRIEETFMSRHYNRTYNRHNR